MDEVQVDKSSDIPLHVQLKNILKEKICLNKFTDKIPSERELMDQFSVSRSTVRQAINALVLEGVLEKVQGRGTYVSMRPMEEWLGNLSTFNEIIKEMGMKPSIKIIDKGFIAPSGEVAQLFDTENEIYFLKRLRYANEMPISLEEQYYPLEIGQELDKYDLNDTAIYDLLESSVGITLWEAEQVITCTTPTKEECTLLNLKNPQSALLTERILFDINNRPVEFEKSIFRSDIYSFRIRLTRQRNGI